MEIRDHGNLDALMTFIETAINEHKSSLLYRKAEEAQQYYDGENPTISRFEKIIYDMQGRAHRDLYSANHKIKSPIFGIAVDQEVSYLLGNGVTFQKEETKKRLETPSRPFDSQIMKAAREALIGGVAFGFWNYDHVEVYAITEFVPLYDAESGALSAGIRFWQIDSTKPLRATLFELDGYTEYIRRKGEKMQELQPKRGYILHSTGSRADRARGLEIYQYENYPGFPVVPLMNNSRMRSELCGKRNTIDAYDLVSSNMVNNVDEGNLIYWVLNNYSGMDDLDDENFLKQLHTTRVLHPEGDGTVEAHTLEAPFAGTQAAGETLEKRLYRDFQMFDSRDVTAANQSATAIKAAYTPTDLKTDRFETQVTELINGILALAGIDDTPTYTRNKISNTQEEVQTVLMGAEYFGEEYVARKLLTILGDGDMAGKILKQRDADALSRFSTTDEEMTDDGEAGRGA